MGDFSFLITVSFLSHRNSDIDSDLCINQKPDERNFLSGKNTEAFHLLFIQYIHCYSWKLFTAFHPILKFRINRNVALFKKLIAQIAIKSGHALLSLFSLHKNKSYRFTTPQSIIVNGEKQQSFKRAVYEIKQWVKKGNQIDVAGDKSSYDKSGWRKRQYNYFVT